MGDFARALRAARRYREEAIADPPARQSENAAAGGDPRMPIGVSWKIAVAAVVAALWFVVAGAILFRSGIAESDYVLWIAAGFGAVFFALVLGLAHWAAADPRWSRRRREERTLAEFEESDVATATGAVPGSEVMVQLLVLPIALAIGATVLALVFWLVR